MNVKFQVESLQGRKESAKGCFWLPFNDLSEYISLIIIIIVMLIIIIIMMMMTMMMMIIIVII